MKRRLCEDCMEDYEIERNDGTPFPSFTVLGGMIGGIAGLTTGLVVLAPAGLLTGLAADVIRCEECGSERNVHEVLIEKDDEWGTRVYQSIPSRFDQNPRHYRYDELEGRFTLVEDHSPETPELDISLPDLSFDYDVSFDTGDASLQVGPSGPDAGGAGEGSGAPGSGDGGDSGGSASGGGSGGGE